jgi:hypothetical protein
MDDRTKYYLIGGVVVVIAATAAIVSLSWSLLKPVVSEPKPDVAVLATVAPQVHREIKEDVAVPAAKVRAYRPAVKHKLKLPQAVQDDAAQSVVSASQVAADEHPQTVTAVLDTATGVTTQYVKEEPLPWVGVQQHSEAGMYAGVQNGQPAVKAYVRQELLQVKALHLGAIAEATQVQGRGLDTFAGFGVWARW